MAFLRKHGGIWWLYWEQDGKKHGRSLHTRLKRVAEQYFNRSEYELSQRQRGQQTDIALHQFQEESPLYSKATKKQSSCGRHDVPRVGRFIEYCHGSYWSSRRTPSDAVGRGWCSLFATWFPGGATICRPYVGCPPPLPEPDVRDSGIRPLT